MKPYLKLFFYLFIFSVLLGCQFNVKELSILITDVKLIDGRGNAAYTTDIGIKEDKIIWIGDHTKSRLRVSRQIDGTGYIASPGFIDVHTHTLSDLSHRERKANLNYLFQGVTTVVTGNDGGGPVQVGDLLDTWDKKGIGTNAILLAGHGSVRKAVMDMSDEAPSLAQLEEMKSLLKVAMDEGAFGMSTGLYYSPGSFATTEEVIELAKVVADHGGIYDSHIRDESSYNIGLKAAVAEVIEIARKANIAANISHIKALGVDVWGESDTIIQLIEQAQAEGLQITADQYPYPASGTSIAGALVPRWVFANDFEKNINDPSLLPRIRTEMLENMRRRGGATSLLLTSAEKPETYGSTLKEIAIKWKLAPVDAALQIEKDGGSRVASFNMHETDIERFMQRDWVMTSSDGSTGHPRKYGSYPKKIREYVLEKQTISLEEMIRKSSALPAATFRVPLRGKIAEGYYADIILFKPEEVKDHATYQSPMKYAEGMDYVIVNGKLAIDEGEFTGILAGKALRFKKDR